MAHQHLTTHRAGQLRKPVSEDIAKAIVLTPQSWQLTAIHVWWPQHCNCRESQSVFTSVIMYNCTHLDCWAEGKLFTVRTVGLRSVYWDNLAHLGMAESLRQILFVLMLLPCPRLPLGQPLASTGTHNTSSMTTLSTNALLWRKLTLRIVLLESYTA